MTALNNHSILMTKVAYGIDGNASMWYTSYVINRRQRVLVKSPSINELFILTRTEFNMKFIKAQNLDCFFLYCLLVMYHPSSFGMLAFITGFNVGLKFALIMLLDSVFFYFLLQMCKCWYFCCVLVVEMILMM